MIEEQFKNYRYKFMPFKRKINIKFSANKICLFRIKGICTTPKLD
uniref:Uncharacterized protein n=1 Tax=Arundo donax TaxID=35708 RepID=A0A0A9FLL8_ARUDO